MLTLITKSHHYPNEDPMFDFSSKNSLLRRKIPSTRIMMNLLQFLNGESVLQPVVVEHSTSEYRPENNQNAHESDGPSMPKTFRGSHLKPKA